MYRYIYIFGAAIILALSAPSAASETYVPSFDRETHHVTEDFVRYAQKKVSYSEAKSIARRKVRDARVVDVWLNGNRYTVRMQKKNGRVVDVYVDAITGRVE